MRERLTRRGLLSACAAAGGVAALGGQAEGECGIITTLLNRFAAENPDIRVTVSTVAWPGYNQLSAQLGAGDLPDVLTMHESAIPDFQSRSLLASAVHDPEGGTVAVFALNRHEREEMSLEVALRSFPGEFRVVMASELHHHALEAVNSSEVPDEVSPAARSDLRVRSDTLHWALKPLSWNVAVLEAVP